MKNKNKNRKRANCNIDGFTLIELLIVIAIIGILVAVILVSLNAARQKATFASFKTSLNSVASSAKICRGSDSEGEILTDVAGNAICSDVAISDGIYPSLPVQCVDAGDFVVTDGNTDDWIITQSCITGVCEASCSVTGCEFVGC